jgi:hypothetical protein
MAFGFVIDEENNLITVTYDETTSYEDRLKVLDDLVEYLLVNPTIKIFLDITEDVAVMSDEEQISCGSLLASKKEFFDRCKMAVFCAFPKMNVHPLVTTTAYLEGFTNFCLFHSRSEAFQWLQGDIH